MTGPDGMPPLAKEPPDGSVVGGPCRPDVGGLDDTWVFKRMDCQAKPGAMLGRWFAPGLNYTYTWEEVCKMVVDAPTLLLAADRKPMNDLEAFQEIASYVQGSPSRHGICTVCKRGYALNLNGNVRNHYASQTEWCAGGGRPPADLRDLLGELIHPFDDAERRGYAAMAGEWAALEAGLTERGVLFATPFDVEMPNAGDAALIEIDRLRKERDQFRDSALMYAAMVGDGRVTP